MLVLKVGYWINTSDKYITSQLPSNPVISLFQHKNVFNLKIAYVLVFGVDV